MPPYEDMTVTSSYVDTATPSPYADDVATRISSLHGLAATARGRRLDLGLSQAQIAERARVSRQWVSGFEAGKSTAELGLVLRLLQALELHIDVTHDASEPPRRDPSPDARPTVDLDVLLRDYESR